MTSRKIPKKRGEIKDITKYSMEIPKEPFESITIRKGLDGRKPARPFPTYEIRTGISPMIIPLFAVVGVFIVMIIKGLMK